MDLSVRLQTLRTVCKDCAKNVKANLNDVQLAEKLSQRILIANHSSHIAVTCPDIIIDLLNRLEAHNESVEKFGCVLAELNARDVQLWAETYFSRQNVSFLHRFVGIDSEPSAKRLKKSDMKDDVQILRVASSFLQRNPEFYGNHWNFSFLSKILARQPNGREADFHLKWYAAHCVAHVARLSPAALDNLLLLHLDEGRIALLSKAEFESSLKSENRLQLSRVRISKPCNTVDVEGVTIFAADQAAAARESLKQELTVYTSSFRVCLRDLASAVVSNNAVLVTGAVGVGKTKLIEHLATRARKQLFKIQLGNHVDSKTLVGSYCCTDIVGQFRWQPGLLTKAVKEGQWVVLEDLDYASADVISLLSILLQERKLPGAQGQILKANGNFRLFATIRVVGSDKHSELVGNCQSVEGFFSKIHIPLQSDNEIRQILVQHCPDLEMFVPRMVELYRRVQDRLSKEPQSKRILSLRDLVKLISRYTKSITGSDADRMNMFVDAADCFVSYISCPRLRMAIAKAEIGPLFNLTAAEIEEELTERKPSVIVTEKQSVIGRCVMTKRTLNAYDGPIKSSTDHFAQTRISLIMLEKIARCVFLQEPILLVGETGTGKTTVVQYLAQLANAHLRVINLSQQTDMVDLIGGFKPVPLQRSVAKIIDECRDLLSIRSQLLQSNESYLEDLKIKLAAKSYLSVANSTASTCTKMITAFDKGIIRVEAEWREKLANLKFRAEAIAAQIVSLKNKDPITFAFIEGILVTSMRNGDWILLDEINLAEPEMLECLASILDGQQLILQERGDLEPIPVHPRFRIFACMNPATDIGKKDLPVGVRNRFTELYFDEISALPDLHILTHQYLRGSNSALIGKCVELFNTLKSLSKEKLFGATGHQPHFCLRTLCRALHFASQKIQEGNSAPRSLYEGFCLSFLTQVDAASHLLVEASIRTATLGKTASSFLAEPMRKPLAAKFVQFEGYWVPRGSETTINPPSDYIITATVKKNLKDLTRAISARRHPILLQGGTSLGKTSMISYIAKCTGNKCVRVNNHEHTDISEYIGQYLTDSGGALVFKEGILVEAMRKGYWLILDELNLACSEILEALNRVLDDNRKLFIAETQIELEAHENFIVFATQNPPGTYVGRKNLSRAFRNRFIELHFNELPPDELKQILSEKCEVSPAHAAKMVEVMVELQVARSDSGPFSGKDTFITLRDLFKWAERHRRVNNDGFRDWDQLLAEEGYMLLAGRVRQAEYEQHIINVLNKTFKREVQPKNIWNSSETTKRVRQMLQKWSQQLSAGENKNLGHLVMTQQMTRLAILVGQALHFDEPVLIVGETGSGKTTVVQLFAQLLKKQLYTVSCHQHSEASDFLGRLRPCRDSSENGRLFEWNDGPLIKAMTSGDFFLADEISLADASVLERLNSLLEAEKKLFLAEKGEGESFTATSGFWFAATMNPGGDFGKKELSPALRNRFTEIWCPFDANDPELIDVVRKNVTDNENAERVAENICAFSRSIHEGQFGIKNVVSLRDIMAWVTFVNTYIDSLGLKTAFIHGGVMIFLDPIGTGATSSEERDEIRQVRNNGYKCLTDMSESFELVVPGDRCIGVYFEPNSICVMPYIVERNVTVDVTQRPEEFCFSIQTTCDNLMRLVRGLGLGRPLLLEGSPGVGKTSLVVALAKQCGVEITRINLSEQTDISDLFGADLPVEGGIGGQFEWRDGPFLRALKFGHWILLDELNLASQSVLEGLNACLDHRGEIFIPELNQTFKVKQGCTEIFACQNPQRQGGGRKGLPKSFLNRFTQVHVEPMSTEDLLGILTSLFPFLEQDQAKLMVKLNSTITLEIEAGLWGQSGSPWEFNLRDLCRWAEISEMEKDPVQLVDFIYGDRMRTPEDKARVSELTRQIFGDFDSKFPKFEVTNESVQIGDVFLDREPRQGTCEYPVAAVGELRPLRSQRKPMRSIASCLNQGMFCLVVGESGCGKTSIIRQIAALAGRKLVSLPITAEMDTMELLGGFEQMDLEFDLANLMGECCESARALIADLVLSNELGRVERLINDLHLIENHDLIPVEQDDSDKFLSKILFVQKFVRSIQRTDLEGRLGDLISKHRSLSARGSFTWYDSVLVQALQKGDWVLAENVNFCGPAVLDRLNSLLEKNGSLSITEQGVQNGVLRTLRPHPDFRLIMTMDPKHGEISRAMRNRAHEIYILPLDETIFAHDLTALLEARGCYDQRISEKLWTIFEQLKPLRSCSLINLILKAVDYMEDEAGRGGSALQTLVEHLLRNFEGALNGDEIDVELVVREALEGLAPAKGQQSTASVGNYARANLLAEHFEDCAILNADLIPTDGDHERSLVSEAIAAQIFCENVRLADCPHKLMMIRNERFRAAVVSLLDLFESKVPGYPRQVPVDHRFNFDLCRRMSVRNHFANTFVFCLLREIYVCILEPFRSDGVGVGVVDSDSDTHDVDTYISCAEKLSDLHPHVMVRQLPKLLDVIRVFIDELSNIPLSDEQLFDAKRSIYAIWRYNQSVHRPVRTVDVDIRRIAITFIWAVKRMRKLSTKTTLPLLSELVEQLEKSVPALFHKARKLRRRAISSIATVSAFKCKETAELFDRAIRLEHAANQAAERVSLQLSDEGLAVVSCALTELEQVTAPIGGVVRQISRCVLERGQRGQRPELVNSELVNSEPRNSELRNSELRNSELVNQLEMRLAEFLNELHRYDENYVYRLVYDHDQQLAKHLQPLNEVLRIRAEIADPIESSDVDFMSKFVDLAQASWVCLSDIESSLRWRPPHIMLTLDSANDLFTGQQTCDRRRKHSSALVLDSAAIVTCLKSLVDAETNAANLHLDYSPTKLRELAEIRRLLWKQLPLNSELCKKNISDMSSVFERVRHVVRDNRTLLTEELRQAFAEAETAAASVDLSSEDAAFENHIFYIRASYFVLLAFTPYDTMDPYEKVVMKKRYLSTERQYLSDELQLRSWLQRRRTGSAELEPHPVYDANSSTCSRITQKIRQLDERFAYRPEISQYGEMAKMAQSYVENIVNREKIQQFVDAVRGRGSDVDGQFDTWLTNQKEYIARIRVGYPFYRDISTAFLFGAAQLTIAIESLDHYSRCEKKVQANISELIRFPRASLAQPDPGLPVVNELLSLTSSVSRKTPDDNLNWQWQLKLRECRVELLEIVDLIRTSSAGQQRLLEKADRILAWFSGQYVDFIEQEAERALTKDSLYEMRTNEFKGEERDDVLDAKAVAALFPSFEEIYEDITDDSDFLNKDKNEEKEKKSTVVQQPTVKKFDDNNNSNSNNDDDISFIHRVFLEIVASISANRRHGPQDIVSCLLERFRLFHELRADLSHNLNMNADDESFACHLVAATHTGWMITGNEQKLQAYSSLRSGRQREAHSDFYNDSNISELIKCQPIVHQIVERCQQLLAEFENHHGLVQILKVSYRVLSLPVTSSLMKVLTGLMRLLTELEQWNKNAHKGIKMSTEIEQLAQLITSWRKLELQSWSGLLESAMHKKKIEATKCWLRLQHALSKSSSSSSSTSQGSSQGSTQGSTQGSSVFTADNETVKMSSKELVSALVNLMETSTTVGDFEHKLQMMSDIAAYLKVRNLPGDARIQNVILNANAFYRQFLPTILDKIESTRAEIDKEIKDFIKIVRYKDTSFLAVQQSADKSHKKLHGCLKKFEKVLLEPTTTYIQKAADEATLASGPTTLKKGKRKSKIVHAVDFELNNYHIKTVAQKYRVNGEDSLSDIVKLHRLSRNYLQEVGQRLRIQPISNVIDDFAAEVADSIAGFARETEKQIRHDDKTAKRKAKNLLQRKKKMLSELFRALTNCGLSYRKGVNLYQKLNCFELLSIQLVRKSDVPTAVGPLVDDIERYFVRNVQKFRELQLSMNSPSKELELYMIERVQGFGTHLFDMIGAESSELHDLCKLSRELRKKLAILKDVASFDSIPEQSSNLKMKTELHSMMLKLSICLHQLVVLMETLPEDIAADSHNSSDVKNCKTMLLTSFTDEVDRFDTNLRTLDSIKSVPFSEGNLKVIQQSATCIRRAFTAVEDGVNFLQFESHANKLTEPYYSLKSDIEQKLLHMNLGQRPEMENSSVGQQEQLDEVDQLIEKCLKKTLYSVQTLHKAFESATSDDAEELFNGSMKLIEDEKKDIFTSLDLKGIVTALTKVENRIASLKCAVPARDLASFVAFMKNFSSHYEYFLACVLKAQRAKLKLLYIVLSLSVTLTEKGFCIPEEFRDELMKDGATQLQEIEDGGFGEGEGQKDTSDKVDCEDQLEDTQLPGKEKEDKQEDDQNDIKDEEDGIEMTEDFDAEAQGPDEKNEQDQNEEEEENEDQNDLDEQMGDVDDVDPFDLDKEMWDKDQDEDQQNIDSDDDAQGGEELEEESQMVAKDDRLQESKKNQDQNDDKEKQKPPEDDGQMDKINTMDDEYEGEKEDPYKNSKENGVDDEDEVEDFELPDQQMKDEENAEAADEDDANEKLENENDSETEGDTEIPADEAMPEELQEDAMEQDTADTDANAQDADNKDLDEEGEHEDEANKNPEVAAANADDQMTPQAEQAEGSKSSAENASDNNQNLAESMQTNDDIDGSGEGQSHTADSGGLGRKSTAQEQTAHEEGCSKENQSKKSSEDRKATPRKPRDSRSIKGDLSDASERKQAGDEKGDQFEHQKNSEPDADNEEIAADMATDEQAEQTQKMASNEEDPDPTATDNDDIAVNDDDEMDVDDDDQQAELNKDDAIGSRQRQQERQNRKQKSDPSKGEHGDNAETVSKEGERIATQTVLADDQSHLSTVNALERYFENHHIDYFASSTWDQLSGVPADVVTWARAEFRVRKLVQELCEEFRLALEPTKVAKWKGDYKTGKRLKMRKVIDYVASGFRKDKIWLRRTQPNKREYQILLAIDDSLSMSDSNAKDRAFDTMVLLTKSLSFLEAGDVGVASFGENVSLVHPFGEPISADTGPKLARHFTFAQKATRIAKLVSLATDLFEKSRGSLSSSSSRKEFAQLLIIVSDGRNIFSEGKAVVQATIQKARASGIFVLYIIVDNPEQNKGSILNIQSASFKNGKVLTSRYLEDFPFPFYIILQNVDRLPNVLGQTLRKWFELVMGK